MGNRKWNFESGGQSKDQLLFELSSNKISLNAYAALLFMSDRFQVSKKSRRVNVVEVSVDALCFKEGALFADIVNAANSKGLELCPLELAPYLRLQYLNQPDDNKITIASAKAFADEKYPNGFYLSAKGGEFWLRGYRATDDWVWTPDSLFAFLEK